MDSIMPRPDAILFKGPSYDGKDVPSPTPHPTLVNAIQETYGPVLGGRIWISYIFLGPHAGYWYGRIYDSHTYGYPKDTLYVGQCRYDWKEEADDVFFGYLKTEPQEIRGTRYFVWQKTVPGELELAASFCRFKDAEYKSVVSASIGWSLAQDAEHGVVIRNVLGEQYTAQQFISNASERLNGFRLIECENIELQSGKA
jgi:hypothetical protein